MKPPPAVFMSLLRRPARIATLATLAALLAAPAAHADAYADVNQLLRNGKVQEAMDQAERHLAAKPRDPQMRFIKSVIQTEAGQTAEAKDTLIQLTQDYPELAEPYNNLAVLYAGQAQLEPARAALEMAIRTKPDYAVAHENLGDVYARLASQSYARALQLDSTNTRLAPKLTLIRSLLATDGAKPGAPGTPSNPVPPTDPAHK